MTRRRKIRRRRDLDYERWHRKKFTGLRDDTEPVGTHIHPDGREYIVRDDNSKYPKLTSIPVSRPTRRFFSILRHYGRYNNYDEMLLELTKTWFYATEPDIDRRMVTCVEEYFSKARLDILLRTNAREKAGFKGRYFPR